MPARLIIGEADLVTSPTQVEEFTRRIGPQSVEVFQHAGHFVQGEQPERYARFVLDFIAEVERQRANANDLQESDLSGRHLTKPARMACRRSGVSLLPDLLIYRTQHYGTA